MRPHAFVLEKLSADGYPNAEAIPEDWGWCVTCYRDPFMLWIGRGNSESTETPDSPELLKTQPIIWQCFVEAEVPFRKRISGKPEAETCERELNEKLRRLLSTEQQIQMVECP